MSADERTPSTRRPLLTRQQERAMLAFLYRDGFEDEATDSATWDWGVRPWPTLSNLVEKGLIERRGWWGPEEGYLYRLTDVGRAYMAGVVASRASRRSLPGAPSPDVLAAATEAPEADRPEELAESAPDGGQDS